MKKSVVCVILVLLILLNITIGCFVISNVTSTGESQ
jgi:hypothetical protein